MKLGCATIGGLDTRRVRCLFSITFENVEVLCDVFYRYSRKWDAQPRGGSRGKRKGGTVLGHIP